MQHVIVGTHDQTPHVGLQRVPQHQQIEGCRVVAAFIDVYRSSGGQKTLAHHLKKRKNLNEEKNRQTNEKCKTEKGMCENYIQNYNQARKASEG